MPGIGAHHHVPLLFRPAYGSVSPVTFDPESFVPAATQKASTCLTHEQVSLGVTWTSIYAINLRQYRKKGIACRPVTWPIALSRSSMSSLSLLPRT